MSCTPQTPEDVLVSLSSISKRTLFCVESSPGTLHATTDHNPNVPPVSVQVPKPPPLLSRLLEAGAPQHLAQEMHTMYLDHAKKLRSRYMSVISRLQKELPRLPADGVRTFHDQLVPLLLRTYTKALHDWVREGVDMFHNRQPAAQKKPFNQTFNHDYVPLLEHFFDEDPFPTHADKTFLARKSGMSYQQIHVWFQNRRSRSRRVGKVLRKKPMPDGPASPLCVGSCVTKPAETITDEICRDEPKKFDSPGQPLDYYAVSRLMGSAQTELKFDPSWWPRRPCLANPRRPSFDMDRLVEKLSQLSVRDRTSGRNKRHADSLRYPLAATSSITVMPPPTPHPALIRRRDVSLSPLPPLVVPRTSASRSTRSQAFNAPNPSPSSKLLAPPAVLHCSESPCKRQKVISGDSFHRETSSVRRRESAFECSLASLRTPQTRMVTHSTPCLSTNTTPDYVPTTNDSRRVFPVGGLGDHSLAVARTLSRHAIPPWDLRFAVTV
ncbi:hypothetical protein F5141DRAFT_723284 [Pisolithus sp. B1]|nr:hypothetical protein F5141DRAFT_723284 [Pisolithus sp. B1]